MHMEINNREYIEDAMKRFRLVDMREHLDELISDAERLKMSYEEFLTSLIKCEDCGKTYRRQERLKHDAHFESCKELEDIDYSFNPSLDYSLIESLGRLDFLRRNENIVIIGPPGVGKSMIATGIGRKACMAGYKVLFVSAQDLIDKMVDVATDGYLKEYLAELDKVELLIIDELSYLRMDKEKESLFFQIIRQRYEKSSLIITTNLPMGRWDELFTGQLAATAILDRLVHHCTVMSITGDSYRVKGNVKQKEEKNEQRIKNTP